MIDFIVLILVFAIIGTCLGTFTGLIPGLHVNTVAILLLASLPIFMAAANFISGVEFWTATVFVAVVITATSISHTFLDFIPSTFLGAPDEDTALSVLPAHQLMLQGKGYHAVYLSAVGSGCAVVFACLLLFPFVWLLGKPGNLYPLIRDNTLYILLFLVAFLIFTETGTMGGSRVPKFVPAIFVFLTSGILGLVVLELPSSSPLGLPSTVLFPLFSGLFGISTLSLSIIDRQEVVIPPQDTTCPIISPAELKPTLPGCLAGSMVGFLPGVSSAHAALVAMIPGNMNSERSPGENRGQDGSSPGPVILTLGAVNTANAVFVIVALFLIQRARSGAAVAIQELIPIHDWAHPLPVFLGVLLIAIVLSSLVAFHLTLLIGKYAANNISRIPYERVVSGVIAFIIILVLLFNGVLGIAILMVSSLSGMIPPMIGVRRSHLMGVLLIPVLLYLM